MTDQPTPKTLYRVLADRPEWLNGSSITDWGLTLRQAEAALQEAYQYDYDLLEQDYGEKFAEEHGSDADPLDDNGDPADREIWEMLLYSYGYDGWSGARYEIQSYTDHPDNEPDEVDGDGEYTTVARFRFDEGELEQQL